ncbi:MAG: (d)CMP kinase [Eubacteriales bacterium]
MGKINIAIDGPAGAGKSTAAKEIAKRLKIYYLDTGAMYRAFAYKVIKDGLDTKNHNDVLKTLEKSDVIVKYIDGEQKVIVNGEDVTPFIRTQQVAQGASDVAVFKEVRVKLVHIQRQVAKDYDVVMDGRDIGTNVLTDCKNKFYVTASADERARRRFLELGGKDSAKSLEVIKQEIIKRDENDSNRDYAL